jgi:excisionase family DNA binding protein
MQNTVKAEVIEQTQKALSVDMVVSLTGLKKNYIYKLISQKKIPHYKPMGGRVYFKREDIENFIFRNRQAADYEAISPA